MSRKVVRRLVVGCREKVSVFSIFCRFRWLLYNYCLRSTYFKFRFDNIIKMREGKVFGIVRVGCRFCPSRIYCCRARTYSRRLRVGAEGIGRAEYFQ